MKFKWSKGIIETDEIVYANLQEAAFVADFENVEVAEKLLVVLKSGRDLILSGEVEELKMLVDSIGRKPL